tara:strand:+ start:1349 stop:1873 length:525 start_codon:yes stop_codon:yes gene_type:complete
MVLASIASRRRAPVPWHDAQQTGHAAPAADPGKGQSCTYEGGQAEKGGRDQQAQRHAGQHQQSGRNLHLPHDLERLASVDLRGKPRALPGIESALEQVAARVSSRGLKYRRIVARPPTGTTMKHHPLAILASKVVDPREWQVRRAGNVRAGMLVGIANIDQARTRFYGFMRLVR